MAKPNILWIYCDELRTDALGCYGHDTIQPKTPHIDSLAENGTLFEQCFCNSPVCVPSRVSTVSGRYPEETGVYHNEAAWPGYAMPTEVVTFPQVFAENGYVTANFGKWHVPPEMNRWDVCDPTGASMGDLLDIVGRDDESLIMPNGVPTYLGGAFPSGVEYPHNVLVDNAIAWMSQADQPFLARLSFLEPHTPVFPPPPFDALYDPAQFRGHLTSAEGASAFERQFAAVLDADTFSAQEIRLAQAYYYGLVAWVDSQVGRVRDFLNASGLMDNTILVFGADHGASMGEGGCWAKQIFAPQVHRVPRLIQWANTLPAGVRRRDVTEGLDLARTLFGLCGIEAPNSFRGRDLFADAAPSAVYATLGFGDRSSRTFPNLRTGSYSETVGWPRRACVRTTGYRLDKNVRVNGRTPSAEEQDVALFNVADDPQENHNLAGDPRYEAIQAELTQLLDTHIDGATESDMAAVYRHP
jgi:arylsulfatase A-like enzyme